MSQINTGSRYTGNGDTIMVLDSREDECFGRQYQMLIEHAASGGYGSEARVEWITEDVAADMVVGYTETRIAHRWYS